MNLVGDRRGQGDPFSAIISLGLLIVAVVTIYLGGTTVQGGCVGSGLVWIGIGVIVGDFGGYLQVKNPYVLIAGGAGFVLLLIGALMRASLTC